MALNLKIINISLCKCLILEYYIPYIVRYEKNILSDRGSCSVLFIPLCFCSCVLQFDYLHVISTDDLREEKQAEKMKFPCEFFLWYRAVKGCSRLFEFMCLFATLQYLLRRTKGHKYAIKTAPWPNIQNSTTYPESRPGVMCVGTKPHI